MKPQQKENSKQIHRIAVTSKVAVAYIKHTSTAFVLIYILYVMRCFTFYKLLEYWKLFNFKCLAFNFICSIPCTVIYLLNKTNKMHIYCIFFRIMHLHISVLSDHPQGAHRVHQCCLVRSPIYKYLQ
jgi:hypothetical protein